MLCPTYSIPTFTDKVKQKKGRIDPPLCFSLHAPLHLAGVDEVFRGEHFLPRYRQRFAVDPPGDILLDERQAFGDEARTDVLAEKLDVQTPIDDVLERLLENVPDRRMDVRARQHIAVLRDRKHSLHADAAHVEAVGLGQVGEHIVLLLKRFHVPHVVLVDQHVELARPRADRLGVTYKHANAHTLEVLQKLDELIGIQPLFGDHGLNEDRQPRIARGADAGHRAGMQPFLPPERIVRRRVETVETQLDPIDTDGFQMLCPFGCK